MASWGDMEELYGKKECRKMWAKSLYAGMPFNPNLTYPNSAGHYLPQRTWIADDEKAPDLIGERPYERYRSNDGF